MHNYEDVYNVCVCTRARACAYAREGEGAMGLHKNY